MNPRVIAVKAMDGNHLRLVFSNGKVRLYDCSPLLDFGVFQELRDPAYFRQVHLSNGTVAWPHEQDICPDTLYEESIPAAGDEDSVSKQNPPCPARSIK